MDFVLVILVFLLILALAVFALVFVYMLTRKDPKTGVTPPIILKMRRYVLLALGVGVLVTVGFDFYRMYGTFPSILQYVVMAVVGLLIGSYWLRKNAGTVDIRKLHFDTDESFIMPISFESTCQAIPTVVARNRWKLVEANEQLGHFQVKIGMSMKTWGEVMFIDVSPENAKSSKISVRCSALHQIYDYGKNYADITKLHTELLKTLGLSKYD